MARVSGSLSWKVAPWPTTDRISILPRSFSMCRRTTSMPTPRPLTLVTCAAVENPGPFRGRLDPMIHGIAHHVHQRIGELLDDGAVELDIIAHGLHLHVLIELA